MEHPGRLFSPVLLHSVSAAKRAIPTYILVQDIAMKTFEIVLFFCLSYKLVTIKFSSHTDCFVIT